MNKDTWNQMLNARPDNAPCRYDMHLYYSSRAGETPRCIICGQLADPYKKVEKVKQ